MRSWRQDFIASGSRSGDDDPHVGLVPEKVAVGALEPPIALVRTGGGWCNHVGTDVDDPSRFGQIDLHRRLGAQQVAADENPHRARFPSTLAVVAHTPRFGKLDAAVEAARKLALDF